MNGEPVLHNRVHKERRGGLPHILRRVGEDPLDLRDAERGVDDAAIEALFQHAEPFARADTVLDDRFGLVQLVRCHPLERVGQGLRRRVSPRAARRCELDAQPCRLNHGRLLVGVLGNAWHRLGEQRRDLSEQKLQLRRESANERRQVSREFSALSQIRRRS